MKFLFDRQQEFEIPGLPLMPGIEGHREGRPLAPKRGAREEGDDEGFFLNKFN